jgi:hypothetical protein
MHIGEAKTGRRMMSKHARTTITIPADLKARMEAIEDVVNWSALACQAFEQKLAEIIKQKGTGNMTDVVNRLRVSKRKFVNQQYQEGHATGKKWAKDAAEAGELIRLNDMRDLAASAWNYWFTDQKGAAYSTAEFFVFQMWPEDDGDRSAAYNFWEQRGFDQFHQPKDDFVCGFAEGALSIWDEVKDQV